MSIIRVHEKKSLGVMSLANRDDWETPASIFDPLNREFEFQMDLAATSETAKMWPFYTKEDDALTKRWEGVCWLNPPYGNEIKSWMKKAHEESQKGAVIVALIPSRTDTSWWHEYVMPHEVRFLKGRIKFVGAKKDAPFPSAVVVFRALRGVA